MKNDKIAFDISFLKYDCFGSCNIFAILSLQLSPTKKKTFSKFLKFLIAACLFHKSWVLNGKFFLSKRVYILGCIKKF